MYVTVCPDEMSVLFSMMMLTINNAAIGFAGTVWIASSMEYYASMRCMLLSVMMLMVNDAGIGF